MRGRAYVGAVGHGSGVKKGLGQPVDGHPGDDLHFAGHVLAAVVHLCRRDRDRLRQDQARRGLIEDTITGGIRAGQRKSRDADGHWLRHGSIRRSVDQRDIRGIEGHAGRIAGAVAQGQ